MEYMEGGQYNTFFALSPVYPCPISGVRNYGSNGRMQISDTVVVRINATFSTYLREQLVSTAARMKELGIASNDDAAAFLRTLSAAWRASIIREEIMSEGDGVLEVCSGPSSSS